jgi:hypothetical protein
MVEHRFIGDYLALIMLLLLHTRQLIFGVFERKKTGYYLERDGSSLEKVLILSTIRTSDLIA